MSLIKVFCFKSALSENPPFERYRWDKHLLLVLKRSPPFRRSTEMSGKWQGHTLKMSDLRTCIYFHVLKKMSEERQRATLGVHSREAFIL